MSNLLEKINLNHEVARVEQLIPRELRKDSALFIEFLKEYYRFMNEPAAPSYEISKANEQHDLYQIEEKYLQNLQSFIAAYVPNSRNIPVRQLYRLIVKYFYNNRGSRESIDIFFRLFFNTTANIVENFDPLILRTEEITPENSDHQTRLIKAWKPYSYGIETNVLIGEWEAAYKALVHPIGWRFFALLLVIAERDNLWSRVPSYYFNYRSQKLEEWFFVPPPGCHTPVYQAEALYRNTYFFDIGNYSPIKSISYDDLFPNPYIDSTTDLKYVNGFNNGGATVAQPGTLTDLTYYAAMKLDRMDFAKRDFVSNLKFGDTAEVIGYGSLRIDQSIEEYPNTIYYGDFSNVSAIVEIE